ncbi:IclR family transcriptional regulator [Amaricoccus sp.]|uniref:IclR family transcriptional regulator n=1 Tax=Amaricoccus sp. TaxID=1872485 RepID=UPI001B6D2D0E|nr:IclR family transcriptional regulator [Amaricoccus sp.]MBP7001516.1 IclR family transcriptional regulator [Amaricoccus sp.]
MSSVLERTLGILEMLAWHPAGLPVGAIATRLDMPPSAAHRLLNDLARLGYVRQDRAQGDYALTIKLASLGLTFLGQSGVTDVAQPILDRLAAESGELVRLSVIDGDSLVWVGVAQGATGGLRYDPGREQGVVAHLASSAGGRAWLATMSDDDALMAVSRQGIAPTQPGAGAKAPASATELLARLAEARAQGYAVAIDSYLAGMAAMAVPVRSAGTGEAIGCLSIAAPSVRLDAARMAALAPALQAAAGEIGAASRGSRFFAARPAERRTA